MIKWVKLNNLINSIHCSITCGEGLGNETDSCTWKIEKINWSIGDKQNFKSKLWNWLKIEAMSNGERAKIPSTVLVKGSWLAVVGTTRSEVQFFTMFTQNKSKAKVLEIISHTKHTSKSPTRLWLSSFRCPCSAAQMSHFYHLTLLVKIIHIFFWKCTSTNHAHTTILIYGYLGFLLSDTFSCSSPFLDNKSYQFNC